MTERSYSACIVAAGRGERAGGGEPKQFRPLAGAPVLAWSARAFDADPDCTEIIVAHAAGQADRVRSALADIRTPVRLVEGGDSRTRSVENAVRSARCSRVFIQDAARPGLTPRLLSHLSDALDEADGAAPALPLADALVRDGAAGLEPVERSGLWRMQTPQVFHTSRLIAAFDSARDRDFPDEVSLARAAGLDIRMVPGDEANFKLTWPEDFARFEALLAPARAASSLTVTGIGYDVHRLAPGDGVHLCGVFIACPLRLIGHSDADAGLHAITDALLGAAGLGDIGDHFPPSDDRWKGADSAMFLEHAVKIAAQASASPAHCDVTLICESPKIGPHKAAMKARVAALLGLDPQRVNIKATTTEKLGFTGRGEGLAAEAAVTVKL